jgi:hypothetical protein
MLLPFKLIIFEVMNNKEEDDIEFRREVIQVLLALASLVVLFLLYRFVIK